MVFDLRNRVFGEVLVDFSNDSSSHIGMEGMPQVCKRTRRCRDKKRPHIACAHELLQGGGDVSREAMLLEVMPIGILHGATEVRRRTFECASRAIGSLLAGGWVFVDEHAFGFQVQKFLITRVAQEQRFSSITDDDEGVMRDCELTRLPPPVC
jgi:hypothetical protein